ncbi:hypothetical protein H2201_003682 [Coniosporium apollinis]|uniref:NADP-dependent oxidoreductase domain-containing protein n=1 Tax=Coniosporium apollinis TaxID=61459 RepID=A0ABQ9P045_9PEZI|nr:hypothetical protein H2201_003682 [Coniosporium apollinis]
MRLILVLGSVFLPAIASSAAAIEPQIPFSPTTALPIPLLGFGTWNLKVDPSNTTAAVALAIEAGYRHIDCAAAYGNQPPVGKGIAQGLAAVGLERKDIWVTSKLWNDHHAPDKVEDGLDDTLRDLGLDYLDLYLMHWPVGNTGKDGELEFDYIPTWHAMERLLSTKKVKHIGVSNFSPSQLKRLIASSTTKPAVHQMELHPYLQQAWWVQFHQQHDIHVTAYSPLGNLNPTYRDSSSSSTSSPTTSKKKEKPKTPPLLLDDLVLKEIATERNCTIPQVALAWGMGRGTSVIPKSSHEVWIRENYGAKSCALVENDVEAIERVGRKYLHRFNNPGKGWGVKLFEGLDGV